MSFDSTTLIFADFEMVVNPPLRRIYDDDRSCFIRAPGSIFFPRVSLRRADCPLRRRLSVLTNSLTQNDNDAASYMASCRTFFSLSMRRHNLNDVYGSQRRNSVSERTFRPFCRNARVTCLGLPLVTPMAAAGLNVATLQ